MEFDNRFVDSVLITDIVFITVNFNVSDLN